MIAAAFWPKDVIVGLSDFKTNEYAGLLGGAAFEPREENPMLGFRGASRYYDERYREGFGLECRAMRKVREVMGPQNVKLMVPLSLSSPRSTKGMIGDGQDYSRKPAGHEVSPRLSHGTPPDRINAFLPSSRPSIPTANGTTINQALQLIGAVPKRA
jgi:PEP-utilising enzyme, PEP-binding domain